MNKEYIIVGDNNYWYSTCNNLEDADTELKQIKNHIKSGVYEGELAGEAEELYIYEAKEIKSITI